MQRPLDPLATCELLIFCGAAIYCDLWRQLMMKMASLACVPHAHHPACDRKTGWLLHVLLQITLSVQLKHSLSLKRVRLANQSFYFFEEPFHSVQHVAGILNMD
mmetsp:Transcript_25617/g.75754  ORF Transcript_25617/g.75754 Transcript_25617/m.75754 type:complete len:104 (+) Transcript_25617:1610-1921(+)